MSCSTTTVSDDERTDIGLVHLGPRYRAGDFLPSNARGCQGHASPTGYLPVSASEELHTRTPGVETWLRKVSVFITSSRLYSSYPSSLRSCMPIFSGCFRGRGGESWLSVHCSHRFGRGSKHHRHSHDTAAGLPRPGPLFAPAPRGARQIEHRGVQAVCCCRVAASVSRKSFAH